MSDALKDSDVGVFDDMYDRHFTDLSSMMAHPVARKWWKEFGETITGSFDLNGSSWDVLSEYFLEKYGHDIREASDWRGRVLSESRRKVRDRIAHGRGREDTRQGLGEGFKEVASQRARRAFEEVGTEEIGEAKRKVAGNLCRNVKPGGDGKYTSCGTSGSVLDPRDAETLAAAFGAPATVSSKAEKRRSLDELLDKDGKPFAGVTRSITGGNAANDNWPKYTEIGDFSHIPEGRRALAKELYGMMVRDNTEFGFARVPWDARQKMGDHPAVKELKKLSEVHQARLMGHEYLGGTLGGERQGYLDSWGTNGQVRTNKAAFAQLWREMKRAPHVAHSGKKPLAEMMHTHPLPFSQKFFENDTMRPSSMSLLGV